MPDIPSIESSAMVAENTKNEQAKVEKKGDLWCTYCNKPRHIWEKCWKLHGKPLSREWGQQGGSSLEGMVTLILLLDKMKKMNQSLLVSLNSLV